MLWRDAGEHRGALDPFVEGRVVEHVEFGAGEHLTLQAEFPADGGGGVDEPDRAVWVMALGPPLAVGA